MYQRIDNHVILSLISQLTWSILWLGPASHSHAMFPSFAFRAFSTLITHCFMFSSYHALVTLFFVHVGCGLGRSSDAALGALDRGSSPSLVTPSTIRYVYLHWCLASGDRLLAQPSVQSPIEFQLSHQIILYIPHSFIEAEFHRPTDTIPDLLPSPTLWRHPP